MLYPFVEVITAELHSRIWDNANAIGAIAAHEASPTFLPPHLGQGLAYGESVRISADALDLHQDLESFKWRDDGSGNGTGDAAGAKCGNDRLRKVVLKQEKTFRGDRLRIDHARLRLGKLSVQYSRARRAVTLKFSQQAGSAEK